ncbi:MAG: acyl CoA:acetate/3-ketoacid CoA transferase, partial [Rhodocyclaceae bacterium]|nr:acyl CoA:acetate/3-ketoacid CoA transferase [Rhodocyclaceae bacterium]
RHELLDRPLAERLSYNPEHNLFFVDFAGLSVRKAGDIAEIDAAVEAALDGIGHKVNAIVNYDRFSIAPELVDDYIGMVKGIMDAHYHDVTRYTTSTFLRVKLGEAMERRRVAPHIYENAEEARAHLNT